MTDVFAPRPLLNPVLALNKSPTTRDAGRGGKKEDNIVHGRLASQRSHLSAQADHMYRNRKDLKAFRGRFLVHAHMFDDSIAKSHTPGDLFMGPSGTRLVAPASRGYVLEMEINALPNLADTIRTDTTIARRYDISRVRDIRPVDPSDVLRSGAAEELWEQAPDYDQGRGFVLWLPPFRDHSAREAVIERLHTLIDDDVLMPTYPRVQFDRPIVDESGGDDIAFHALDDDSFAVIPNDNENQTSIAIAQRDYRGLGHGRAVVQVPSLDALQNLAASGSAFRLDPISPIAVTSPGEGAEPGPIPPTISSEPIVGVVDGGRTAQRYAAAEAWREPPLIPAEHADTKHGNQVTSVVVHGHEWNNNLTLPPLYCRVGTAQVVPRADSRYPARTEQLIHYLDTVLRNHPETRVWNLSWNEYLSVRPDCVSFLGHELAKLARKHKVLFVVSTGNASSVQGGLVAPPADCEAALVVGSRTYNESSEFLGPCHETLPGYGPEQQLVPHISFYSPLRILGGNVARGTSYPTGLISGLAAHCFQNLRDPSPDLIRALIINQTDLQAFDTHLGWGSPHPEQLPWNCRPGTVTLAWTARLIPGFNYYWEDIPIPSQLIRDGKLCGHASLTTIHSPLVNEDGGPNYYASRLGAALQYTTRQGKTQRLLGSTQLENMPEDDARQEEHKWQAIRRDQRDFTKRGGLTFSGTSFRLYARAYTRDLYQFGYTTNEEVGELEACFVVTFSDGSDTSDMYNNMTVSLGNFVESAVVDQDIDIDR